METDILKEIEYIKSFMDDKTKIQTHRLFNFIFTIINESSQSVDIQLVCNNPAVYRLVFRYLTNQLDEKDISRLSLYTPNEYPAPKPRPYVKIYARYFVDVADERINDFYHNYEKYLDKQK